MRNWKARLYRKSFYFFLKPRANGSYWSWNHLSSICEHTEVAHNKAENGWVDVCVTCNSWLAYDLLISHKSINEQEFKQSRETKGTCRHSASEVEISK